METKITQKITIGTGTCPDCGSKDSMYKTIQSIQDNEITGNWHVIDCPHCHYYEFDFDGPDN